MLFLRLRDRVGDLLDDPHIASWAIDRLVDLERSGRLAERAEALDAWFGDAARLARVLEAVPPWNLVDLLKSLPAERFTPIAGWLGELWAGWRDQPAYLGAGILAAVAPDVAARVFRERLEGAAVPPSPADRSAALAVLAALPHLPPDVASALRARATALAPPPGEHSDPFLFRRPLPAEPGEVGPWLADLLREARPDWLPTHLASLARLLLGHAAGYRLAEGMSSGRMPGGFSAAAALFRRGAPLALLDRLLTAEPRPALEDLLERIAALERTPATVLLSAVERESWSELPEARRPRRHVVLAEDMLHSMSEASVAALRDLAAAVLAESWLAPPEDLRALDCEIALDLLALPLPRAPFHADLAEALRRHPPQDVARGLENRYEEAVNDDPDARLRLIEAAGDLAWPELAPFLIRVTGEASGEEVFVAASDALSRIGAPAVLSLVGGWDDLDYSQQCAAFAAFERVADEQVLRFFIERADDLLEEHSPLFAWAATCVPDARLAAKLASHLDSGSASDDETPAFYVICRLLDESPPELEKVASQLARDRARAGVDDVAESLDRWDAESFLDLPLRCPECGAVAEYRAERIFVDPEPGDAERDQAEPYVADEIPCRSCGVLGDLELVPESRERVLEAAWRRSMERPTGGIDEADDDDWDQDEDNLDQDEDDLDGDDDELDLDDDNLDEGERAARGPFVFAGAELSDGREMAMSEAVALYRRRLGGDPADLESLLRLANIYRSAERTVSAERLYRRALELDPGLVEAAWILAQSLLERERPRDAFKVLREAIGHLARWRFIGSVEGTPASLRERVGELYTELRVFLGASDTPEAPAALFAFRGRKVGRNEPCPCGSGRKYKKCCGAPA